MRVGDVDGRNEVYRLRAVRSRDDRVAEFSGSIVLEPGEKIISFTTDFRPVVWRKRRRSSFKGELFPTKDGMLVKFYPQDGWGTMYLTDRRMLFLRRPSPMHLGVVYGVSKYGDPGKVPWNNVRRASAVVSGGGLEFLEIRYEDIIRYDRGLGSARIRFRVVEDEYVLRLPRKAFDTISSILDLRGVKGNRRPLILSEIPVFWMLIASVETLILLTGMMSDSSSTRRAFALLSLLPLLVGLYSLAARPTVRKVKKRLWGMMKGSRKVALSSSIVSAAFFVGGTTMSYLHGTVIILVFALAFAGIFGVLGALSAREWRIWSRFEEIVKFEYQCPECGQTVTRRDVGCSGCGSCIWWTCSVKLHKKSRRHMRRKG